MIIIIIVITIIVIVIMKMIMIMNMGILINTMEKKKNGGDQLITRMA